MYSDELFGRTRRHIDEYNDDTLDTDGLRYLSNEGTDESPLNEEVDFEVNEDVPDIEELDEDFDDEGIEDF